MIPEASAPALQSTINKDPESSKTSSSEASLWKGMELLSLNDQEKTPSVTNINSTFSSTQINKLETTPKSSSKEKRLSHSPKNLTKTDQDITNIIINFVQCEEEIPENLKLLTNLTTYLNLSNIRLQNSQTLKILQCFKKLTTLKMPINTSKSFARDVKLKEASDLCFQKIITAIKGLRHIYQLDMSKWLSTYLYTDLQKTELFTDMLRVITSRGTLKRLHLSSCTLINHRGLSYISECKGLNYFIKPNT